MNLFLYKIKRGKRALWEGWCNELSTTHRKEAIETLAEENLLFEKCVIFGTGDNSYSLLMHEVAQGGVRPTNTNRKLNVKHRAVLSECLERIAAATVTGYEISSGETK